MLCYWIVFIYISVNFQANCSWNALDVVQMSVLEQYLCKVIIRLKETQTFKAYKTESYKYCIIIAGSNTKMLNIFGIFSSWTQFWTSQVIIRAVHSFIFCFENIFLHYCLHKKPYIFYVIFYYLLYKSFSSCIKAVLHGTICIIRLVWLFF